MDTSSWCPSFLLKHEFLTMNHFDISQTFFIWLSCSKCRQCEGWSAWATAPCATVHGGDLRVFYILYELMLLSMVVTYVMCVICVNALMPLSTVVTYILCVTCIICIDATVHGGDLCYMCYMHWKVFRKHWNSHLKTYRIYWNPTDHRDELNYMVLDM